MLALCLIYILVILDISMVNLTVIFPPLFTEYNRILQFYKQNSAQLDSCEGLAKSQVVMNWTVESWQKIVKDLNIKTATIIL